MGKTTHSILLKNWLRKKFGPTLLLYEPSNSHFGRQIKAAIVEINSIAKRDLIGAKQAVSLEAMLFATDRLIQYYSKILPALKEGKVVVLDRSIYSSYAYQQARGLDKKIIDNFNRGAPKPDLIMVLDTSLEVAMGRLKSKTTLQPEFDAIFDSKEILRKARENYLKLAHEYPKKFRLINTEKPKDQTKKEIRQLVHSYLTKKGLT